MKFKNKLAVLLAILVVGVTGCGTPQADTAGQDATDTADAVVDTWDGSFYSRYNKDRVYDYTDPETGVHYLIYSDTAAHGAMGGITPRLNTDGSVMVDGKGVGK